MSSDLVGDGGGAGIAAGPATRPRRPLSPVARVLAHLGPDFTLLFLFSAVLLGLILAYGASLVWNDGSIFISVSIGASLLGTRFLWRWRSILSNVPGARADYVRAARVILRDWGPLILILFAFESLRSYTGMIRTTSIDDQLYQMDLDLFGVEPTVWIGKFAHPALTDWMTIAYGSYFILPMILATALALRGRREDFRELSTAMLMQLAIGFLLFLVFPAGPPRYYAPLLDGGFEPAQLHSYTGLYELSTGALDAANPLTTRSSFPSLHCALGLCTLVYVHRFGDAVIASPRRIFFWITLPIIVCLWISTVYLRHHWVPDIAAGLILGSVVVTITPHIRRRWPMFEPR